MHLTHCHVSAIVMADRVARWTVDLVAMLTSDMASEKKCNRLIFTVCTSCSVNTPGDVGIGWLEVRSPFACPHNLLAVAGKIVAVCAASKWRDGVPGRNGVHERYV